MAIEITPTSKIKKTLLVNILLSFCLILLIVFIISYFALGAYQKKLSKELFALEKALEKTAEEQRLEKEIFDYQKKIKDMGILLDHHKFASNLFDFLEKVTHPKVWFSSFSLNLESAVVNLSGQSDNFEILGQQILILKKQEIIKNIDVSKISIAREKGVEFQLQLIFDPKIFVPEKF